MVYHFETAALSDVHESPDAIIYMCYSRTCFRLEWPSITLKDWLGCDTHRSRHSLKPVKSVSTVIFIVA